ncbi:hypothetical protein [Catellatospora sp. IY07-71]|uniref:hypothetical protein n=1 Tax=Catellatospora sp. IY07-71 TaxID=2728827 RepID=UPI001BB42899|nr:hypothetical protein [Catellatospora sp. IY07-71]
MLSRRSASWMLGVSCAVAAYASIEFGVELLGRASPQLSWFVASLLWAGSWLAVTGGRERWMGRHIVRQMLAGVPVWGRVLWIVAVLGGLAALTLNGDGFTTPEFSSLYGLTLALSSVLVAWTCLRQIPPASH